MRAALIMLLACAVAHADGYHVVVDHADLEPASVGGYRLRITMSAVALGGQLVDLDDPKTIHAFAGGSEVKAPAALGRYAGIGQDTAIVLVVEANAPFSDVLPTIADALDNGLLAGLPSNTQVALMTYGGAAGGGKLGTLKSARGKVAALASDGSNDEPALLDTIDHAMLALRRFKSEHTVRKIIVVVGDGRDVNPDHERITKIGKRAAADGIRIHTLGFSPTDARRPLLALGELSKRSLGTFRWVRGARSDSWTPALQQLHDEIARQYVVTYFVDDANMAGKKLEIRMTGRIEATSLDTIKIGEAGCAGAPCDGYCTGSECVVPKNDAGSGILTWILIIAGGIVGLIAVLMIIGWRLSKRQPKPAGPVVASPAPGPAPPPSPAASTALPVAGPVLFVLSGPRANQRIPLKHGFTIGKAPTCDLVIDDGYTSGVHAQIGMDAHGNCRLYDRQSTNGTFVNGVRITEYALQHGVSMRIGSTDLRFLAE